MALTLYPCPQFTLRHSPAGKSQKVFLGTASVPLACTSRPKASWKHGSGHAVFRVLGTSPFRLC